MGIGHRTFSGVTVVAVECSIKSIIHASAKILAMCKNPDKGFIRADVLFFILILCFVRSSTIELIIPETTFIV